MSFEHPINQLETRITPSIKFHYITPNTLPRQYSLVNRPLLQVSTIPIQVHPLPPPLNFKRKKTPEKWNKPRRKKIFDRNYSIKSTFFGGSDGELMKEKVMSMGKLYPSQKRPRKAIFSRQKKQKKTLARQEQSFLQTVPLQYSSNFSSNMRLKPPSSLTSYINVDVLRREPRQHYQINVSSREHEDPFSMDRTEQNSFHHDNISSEVKVNLSDDDSQASPSIKCPPLPLETHERFFDKDVSHDTSKNYKLAQVNLYQTTIQGNFSRRPTPSAPALLQSLKKLMDSHVKQHVFPYLLIVMGLFLLLVQVSK